MKVSQNALLILGCIGGSQAFGIGSGQRSMSPESLVTTRPGLTPEHVPLTRRQIMSGILAGAVGMGFDPQDASARFVLDEETGDYVELEDVDWQTAWKQRLDKASSMSKDEIFQAARGAGNAELREGPESDASKKRRAMSACRDATARSKANAGNEKECTARVFAGEVDFLFEAL